MKILILVATPKELGSFDLNDKGVKVVFTGIGKLNAYQKTRQALRQEHFDIILNVGTCGSDKHPIGTILRPSIIRQGDAFLIHGFDNKAFEVSGDPNVSILTGDNFISKVYNSDGILSLPEKARDFDAFDMESYAIATAAAFMLRNVYFLKIVSDNLDGSVKDWEVSANALANKLAVETENFIRENFNKSYSISKR